MKLSLKITLVLLTITMTIVTCGGVSGKMNADKPNLPKTVGVWNRLESPRIINSKNIFKHINGAGELYQGYRFRHLEVFDYTSADQGNILVELYFLESSDDAFGLLSLDWGQAGWSKFRFNIMAENTSYCYNFDEAKKHAVVCFLLAAFVAKIRVFESVYCAH